MKVSKFFLLVLIISCSIVRADAQNATFEETIYQVLEGVRDKDERHLSNLTHPDEGLYIFAAPGTIYYFVHIPKPQSSMENPFWNWGRGRTYKSWGEDFTHLTSIKEEKLGIFESYCECVDCHDDPLKSEILVSKMGRDHSFYDYFVFVDKLNARNMDDPYEPMTQGFLDRMKKLDARTRKVEVYNASRDSLLSFYLTLIDGKWYLLAVDAIVCDDA